MKQLIQHIITSISLPRALARRLVLLLAVLLVGVGQAWGYSYSSLTVNASGGGTVAVTKNTTVPNASAYSSSSYQETNHGGFWDVTIRDYYYVWPKANVGYHCTGMSGGNLSYSWNATGYYSTSFRGNTSRDSRTSTCSFAANTYTIVFNSNGGSGSMSSLSCTYDVGKKLTNNSFTRTGYTFTGWNTKANGTGSSYANGATVNNLTSTHEGTVTLYAQWRAHNYTVVFDGNGSTSGSMSNLVIEKDGAESLTPNAFSKQYTVTYDANGGTCATASTTSTANFNGWATSASGTVVYADQASMSSFLNSNDGGTLNLYAVWSGMSSVTLPNATYEGHVLEGWYSGLTKVGEAGATYTPTSNITLTAIWIAKYTPVITGSNTSMKVGDQQTDAFHFEHVDNPQVHITLMSIDPINNGDGQVIEYDAVNNKIIAHNAGVAKIYFTQAETATINAFTSATYTYTVSKHGNNLVAAISDNSLLVEGTATASFTNQDNTGTAINVSITNESLTNAALAQTVNGSKPVITYSNGVITGQNAGTARITFSQPETNKYTASASYSFDVTVNKVGNTLSTSLSATSLLVDGTSMATFTGRNNSGTIDVNITNESLTNGALAREISGLKPVITYSNGVITGQNAGTARITFSQPETYKYSGYSHYFDITVTKRTNTIKVNNATPYTVGLNLASSQAVTITSDNNLSSPMVSASSNAAVATYSGTGAGGTISTTFNEGIATFSVAQAEDYKYLQGSTTITVNVSKKKEGICYLLDESDEKTLYWTVQNSYQYSWPNEELATAGTLSFEAKRVGYTESITINQYYGSTWHRVDEIGSSLKTSYESFSRQLDTLAKSVQFTSSGAVAKQIRNVKVTRRTFLRTTKSALNFGTTLEGNQITRQFYVEWSSSNTGDIHLSCDNSHFTVSPSIISNTDCASGRTLVTVTYLADEHPTTTDITHSGTITIYDKGRTTPVNVTGTTQPQYNLVVSGKNNSILVEDDLNLSDIITYSYEGNNVVPAVPTYGANSSPFYFTITQDNITSNQNGCSVQNTVVTYNPSTKKFHACNAGTVTVTFIQEEDTGTPAVHAGMKVGGVHRDNISFTITVSKHDPTFTWNLPNAEWASRYKFSDFFVSTNTTTSWSAVSNTSIAEYRSTTDSIYTNFRFGDATFTVTQVENYYWNEKVQDVTTTVAHGEENECYLYESPLNEEIKVWNFMQATWQDTAVAGKVIFDARRSSTDVFHWVSLSVNEYINGNSHEVMSFNNHDDSYEHYEHDLNDYATGLLFKDGFGQVVGEFGNYTNRVKNVKVTRVPWIKASATDVILPTIGKQGHSEATVTVYWSGVEPLRIEKRTNNPHFEVSPDAYFVQTPCTSGFSVLTFAYHSDEPGNETETIVIYDHAHSLEITLHGTTENKEMQEIVWNQSFNPILALGGTIDADSLLTAYATNRQGARTNQPITYTVGNTSIATIENGNHLHITNIGRTTITATVAGNGYYSGATKTLILNVLDGTGCGSLAFSNESEVTLFTVTSDDALAVTRPAEDLYFEAKRDWIAFLNPAAQHVKMRYKVAGDNNWRTQDENGVEIETGALNSDWGSYGPFRLPENTEGIQFYTEFGAYFSQHVRNVYITQRSYLRKDKDALMANIMVNTLTKVGEFTVEYSDKPTLVVENKCSNVKLFVDNPAPNECGTAGKYTYTVSCFSDTIGIIKDTVTVTSGLDDKLSVPVTIYVGIDGEFFFDNGIDHDITHTDWNVTQYWRKDNVYDHGRIPTMASLTTIEGPTVIDYDAYAYKMTITGSGKVTIAPNGSLKVGAGGIHGATMSNLILEADNTGQTGILRLYPGIADEKIPDALVQIYTTAYWDRENGKKAVWQYIGTPVRNPDTNEHIFYQCWLYQYHQDLNKWKNAGNWGHMVPFQAYAFTRDKKSSGPLTGFGGQLNAVSAQMLQLSYVDAKVCENHLANSWTAPIDLKQFKATDFQNVEPIIYCYTMDGHGLAKEIPVYTAGYTEDDILPAMQGFFVKARSNENPQLLLDYERLVWKSEAQINAPLRAPSRMNEEESDLSARVCVQMTSADSITDRLFLLEKDDEGFSADYEVGYDAPKYFVDGLPSIYTYETSGTHLAVSATDDVVGTYLAINTNASQNYTLKFSKVIGEGLGLRDLVTDQIVPISEGVEYAFIAPANSSPMLRFVVVEHEETPQWNENGGTSLKDIGGELKIWQSGEILSVIGAGSHANLRLYDAAGKLILSEFFNEATAINMTALPTGVYMVQVNDKTEKVLR